MDANDKTDKTTQADEKRFCNRGVTCCLLVDNTIELRLCVSPTSHKYCSICRRKLGEVAFMETTENIRFYTLSKNMIYLRSKTRYCLSHIVEEQLSPNHWMPKMNYTVIHKT